MVEVRITIDDERAREVLGPVLSAYLRQVIGDFYILERRFLAFQDKVMTRLEKAERLIDERVRRLNESDKLYHNTVDELTKQIEGLKEITGGVSVIKNMLEGIKAMHREKTRMTEEERRAYLQLKEDVEELKLGVARLGHSRPLVSYSVPDPIPVRRPIL